MAKDWLSAEYHGNERHMQDLLEIETGEREANRMARMIKQAGFWALKTLDGFIWKPGIEIPNAIIPEADKNGRFSFAN
ncbi:MAG: hypothetical protein LBU32_30850 [Clostridiales bacterium]|nr:hypothetical protein [Clostridiales bacterium]